MPSTPQQNRVVPGFKLQGLRLRTDELVPVKKVSPMVYGTRKYAQIVASLKQVGLVEPPVVSRSKDGTYLILDGHIRIHALRELGVTHVDCLISRDDEAFTYNKRINRLTLVQEHLMVREALRRGAGAAEIAAALSIDLSTLRQRNRLVTGICPEVVELLKDIDVPRAVFRNLKRLKPARQLEAASLMIELNKFTGTYMEALVAATPENLLAYPDRQRVPRQRLADNLELMEIEVRSLEAQYRAAEETYAQAQLDLVVSKAYATKLLNDPEALRYLAKVHLELLAGLQSICAT